LAEAVRQQVDFLIVHEPLFYEEQSFRFPGIEFFEKPSNYFRLKKIFERDMCVYIARSNYDECKGGTADSLADALRISVTEKFRAGRIGTIEDKPLSEIITVLQGNLTCENIKIVGDVESPRKYSRVGCYVGPGLAYRDIIEEFYLKGCQVLVSYGLSEENSVYAGELGIVLVELERHSVEAPAMHALAEKLESALKEVKVKFFEHESLIASF